MINRNEGFTCQNCGKKIGPIKYGGSNRNHCANCLYSKHVDENTPGDRLAVCRGLMEPISVYTKRTGEYVLVHKCLSCGIIRHNRAASDDDFDKILSLSTRPCPIDDVS